MLFHLSLLIVAIVGLVCSNASLDNAYNADRSYFKTRGLLSILLITANAFCMGYHFVKLWLLI